MLGSAAICVGYMAFAQARNDGPPQTSDDKAPTTAPKPADVTQKSAEERMTVKGRVLSPDGKPVKAASVDLVARPRANRADSSMDDVQFAVLGQAETDADGRFHIETPRTSSTGFLELKLHAAAPGFGLGWATLNPDAQAPTAELRLHAEQTLRLKLVDISGNPAPGVEVHVQGIGRASDKGGWEGASLWPTPPQGLRAWPRSAKSDDQGKLTIAGLVPDFSVNLIVSDPRYARQNVDIEAASLATSKEITVTLEPAQIIEGRVLAADTGQPIPNAAISVKASFGALGARFTSTSRADESRKVQGQSALRRLLPRARRPRRRPTLPGRRSGIRVDQGSSPQGARHQAGPRQSTEGQGD